MDMKRSLLVGLVEVVVVNLTLFSTICCGMPAPTLGQGTTIHSRLSRSVHALRARLCPEGTSSKNCFYSQLSMFMQMHEPLRDLTTSRIIGKRSMSALDFGSTPNILLNSGSNERDGIALLRELLVDNAEEQQDVFDPNSLTETSDYDIVNTNGIHDLADHTYENNILSYLTNAGIDPVAFHQYVNERINDLFENDLLHTDTVTKRMNDINGYSNVEMQYVPLNKRQIVCPPGKTRLNCYNDAFAYYMRLLKTVEDH